MSWIRSAVVGVLAACLAGSPALAQGVPEGEEPGGLGLDLSEEKLSKEQEAKEQEASDASRPALTEAPATEADREKAAASAMQGERDITQEDRVKSVQRKVYLRNGRFELTPMASASINDPFFWKFTATMRVGYYFADTLALSGRFSLVSMVGTDDRKLASQTYSARILRSVPLWVAMSDLEWSPFYGKVAIFNSILHFDAYLVGGLGVVYTETSRNHGPNPAADLGGGLRFQVFDYLATGVSVINTSYVDQPLGTSKSTTQNVVSLYASVSVFFPFRSTGRESE